MKKVILIVLDSAGVGASADAAAFGDAGCHTLAHIADYFAQHQLPFALPNLAAMGLSQLPGLQHLTPAPAAKGHFYTRLAEASVGKDTVTGHWEIAGLVTQTPFPTYPQAFPLIWSAPLSRRPRRKYWAMCLHLARRSSKGWGRSIWPQAIPSFIPPPTASGR